MDLEGPGGRRPGGVRLRPEDLLFVIQGSLRLELESREPVVLGTGETFVIPPHVPFRGYRWPRDGKPCLFLAVTPADATFRDLVAAV